MPRSIIILAVILLIAGVSPAEWQLTTHGVCSPTTISTDSTGNRILLGVFRGGYWLTENGGQDWVQLNSRITDSDLLQVNSFRNAEAVDPQADTLMINVWGHQPFEGRNQRHTLDGGGSFSRLEDIADLPDSVTALTLNTPATILRQRPGKAYLLGYSDFAILENEEWTIVNLLPWCRGVQDMFVEQVRPDTVYAYGRWGEDEGEYFGGVISSHDGGNNWTRLTHMEELTEEEGFVMALKRLNGDTLIAMTLWQQNYDDHPPFLWSTDGGTNWEWIESSGLPDWMASLTFEVCPGRPGRILFGGGTATGVWESNDYGQTWDRLLRGLPEVPAISGGIYRNPYSDQLYVLLNGQGVYRSTDHGDSWQQVPLPPIGVSAWAYDGLLVHEEGRFEVTNNSDLFFSLDDSDVFAQIPRPVSATDVSWLYPISLTTDEIVITSLRAPLWQEEPVDYFSTWRSYDQGETWEEGPETEWATGTSPIVWFTFADSVLISGRFGPTYKISHDNGESWETHDPGFIYQYMRPMGDILYLVKQFPQGDVMRSVDFGESWESMDFPDPDLLQIPDAEILDLNDTLYVNAHGQTWSYYPPWDIWQPRGTLPTESWDLFTLNWDMVAGPSDTLMIAGANQRHQLFISEDCGWSWYEQPIELPGDYHGETCWQLKYDKWRDRLWIDTGYGLAYKDNPTLSVGEEVWTFIPANYITLDAYPNPFNISSTIRYSLQRPAEIKLDVFDILGRQVATLAEGMVAPGEHRASFDGSSLASGVYFVQLDTGGDCIRRKIVLTK